MHADYWHELWRTNIIGFHRDSTHPLLLKHLDTLRLVPQQRIFVPLCGKSLDIAWLLAQGFRVTGVELSHLAVTQLFDELGVKPEVTKMGALDCYRSGGLEVYQGDIFDLAPEMLGVIDAVYDRAAIVALPETMRGDYTCQIRRLSANTPQLLIHYEYDQSRMDGPPFSVPTSELKRHYSNCYTMTLLESIELPAANGSFTRVENIWVLRRVENASGE